MGEEMIAKVRILKTKPEDVKQLADVYYITWLATYPNKKNKILARDITYHYRNRHMPEELEKRRKQITNPTKGTYRFVAKIGRKLVGLCTIRVYPDKNQLTAIYVLPKYQGKGIGRMLWNKAKSYFNKDKKTIVIVVEYNENAIKFYEQLGFKKTGKKIIDTHFKMRNGAMMPEIEMRI